MPTRDPRADAIDAAWAAADHRTARFADVAVAALDGYDRDRDIVRTSGSLLRRSVRTYPHTACDSYEPVCSRCGGPAALHRPQEAVSRPLSDLADEPNLRAAVDREIARARSEVV